MYIQTLYVFLLRVKEIIKSCDENQAIMQIKKIYGKNHKKQLSETWQKATVITKVVHPILSSFLWAFLSACVANRK